jgi:CheY-like chemotaxis protein
MTNIQALVSGWRSVSGLWTGIMDGSGSNRNPVEDRPSGSGSPAEKTVGRIRPGILIAEDSDADVYLIERAIQRAGISTAMQVVRDGEAAIRWIDESVADNSTLMPALIILDINLPRKRGSDVLKHVRSSPKVSAVPVIVVSTSDTARDRDEMTKLGANAYFRKPSEYAEFMKFGELVKNFLESV